jgi:hypothetical protein
VVVVLGTASSAVDVGSAVIALGDDDKDVEVARGAEEQGTVDRVVPVFDSSPFGVVEEELLF